MKKIWTETTKIELKNKTILNAQWQTPVPYVSKLYIPPTNYHSLAAQQEP